MRYGLILFLLLLPSLSYAALVAHYPLDSCEAINNGIVADLTANYPAAGRRIGSQEGKVLKAGEFNGSNSYISLPANALNDLYDFSFAFWFNAKPSSSGINTFVAASNSTANFFGDTEFEITLNADKSIEVELKASNYLFSTASLIEYNRWQHVVFTRTNRNLCLYVNGQNVSCKRENWPFLPDLFLDRAELGAWVRWNGNLDNPLNGLLDEVLIFNHALSASEVLAQYQQQNNGLNFDGSPRASQCLSCLSDNFNQASLTEQWQAYRKRGTFTPQIINNRLRLTEARGGQATAVNFQRLFPARNNLVQIEFDYYAYGGTGADGTAVVLSDSDKSPIPGSFGGPLGYGYRSSHGIAGFTGGWLGVGIDEFGNFSREGGDDGVGRRRQSVAVRGSGEDLSGYRYLAGSCNNGSYNTTSNCLTPAVDATGSTNPHRYQITVDSRVAGQAIVEVKRDVGAGFTTVVNPFNALSSPQQAPLPEDFLLALTGSTGGSTNIHELDNIEICAIESKPLKPKIDHIRLVHNPQTVRCLSSPIEVQACVDAACSELYQERINVELTTSAGSFASSSMTFTNGRSNAYLRHPTGGTAQIGIVNSTPSTPNPVRCFVGNQPSSCNIQFTDAGLAFFDETGTQPVVGAMRAGEAQNIVLKAVGADGVTGACEARAQGNQVVQMAMSCENPTSCVSAQQLTLNTQTVAANNQGSQSNTSAVNVTFDNTGSAPLSLNYSDVGLLQLYASLTLPANGVDLASTLTGQSNGFVSQPYALQVDSASVGGTANPATTSTGTGFTSAGGDFSVLVSSRNKQGNITPNFGRETTSQRATVQLAELTYPTPNQGDASLLTSGVFLLTPTAGVQVSHSVNWQEAGSIKLHAAMQNGRYLTQPSTSLTPASATIGRFYPDHFTLASSNLTNSCSTFSYMNEPRIGVSYTVQAQSTTNRVLQNYHQGDYSGVATMAFAARNLAPSALHTNLGSRFSAPIAQWQRGELTLASNSGVFARQPLPHAPDGAFEQLQLGLQVSSEIDNRNFSNLNMTQSTTNNPCVNCDAVAFAQTLSLRYGRLVLDNAFAPEGENLPLSLKTQYWNGTQFVQNSADNCTHFDASLLSFTGTPALSATGAGTLNLGTNEQNSLVVSPPNVRGTWQVQYNAPAWLEYYWRTRSQHYDEDPNAEIMFGRYRANPRQIYKREKF